MGWKWEGGKKGKSRPVAGEMKVSQQLEDFPRQIMYVCMAFHELFLP